MNDLLTGLLLLGVGLGMGGVLRWSSRRLDPRVTALQDFAARHRLTFQESGPTIRVFGGFRGRAFSLSWAPGTSLLVGVDCATADRGTPEVQDGTLLSRWTNPPAHLFEVERLEVLVEEMVSLAEDQERSDPAPPEID